MSESCKQCRFYLPKQLVSLDEVRGLCRRHAPRCLADDSWTDWALTEPGDWCGDFEPLVKTTT